MSIKDWRSRIDIRTVHEYAFKNKILLRCPRCGFIINPDGFERFKEFSLATDLHQKTCLASVSIRRREILEVYRQP